MKTVLITVTFEAKLPNYVDPSEVSLQIVGTPEVNHNGQIVGQIVSFDTVYAEHIEDY